MTTKTLDLNCDMGEGYGIYSAGDDDAMFEHISSANIACGFHAGDPSIMAKTVRQCRDHGVCVGAHPSFPDRQGFGRREMHLAPGELYDLMVYQIGALHGVATAAGVALAHVKPHGILYSMAGRDIRLARAIAQAAHDIDPGLTVLGTQGTAMEEAAAQCGLHMACEVYADRTYQNDGRLTPRHMPGALITDLQQSLRQVRQMVLEGSVRTLSGKDIPVRADTLCLHGDQPSAPAFAREINAMLTGLNVRIARVSPPTQTV